MELGWCERGSELWTGPQFIFIQNAGNIIFMIYVLCNLEYQEKKIVCPEILLLGIEDRCLVPKADL